MRRKRPLIGKGASKANGTSHKSSADVTDRPSAEVSPNRPWPVEATVLTGISMWAADEACRYDQDHLNDAGAHKYRMWSVASLLTAASSLVSCCFVWWKCRMTSTLSPAPIGADPDGLVIGSTLVPLVFCSMDLFAEKCGLRDIPRIDFLEPFALASSTTSLNFAMSAVLLQRNKRGGSATNHALLTSCILFVIMKVMMIAKNDVVLLVGETMTTVVVPCVVLQAILICLYSRQNPSSSSVYAAFTPGEWCCVAQLLSFLVLGFLFINIEPTRPKLDDSDMHLAISHGGIVGCIIGCVLSSVVNVVAKKRIHGKSVMFVCATKLFVIVSVTVTCVEIVARRWNAEDAAYSNRQFIPTSLWWLFFFLRTPDRSMPKSFQNAPRFVFLVYWLIVLSLAAFPAHRMASYLRNLPESTKRRKLVVVSRKYFHFVAVLLFLPPTVLAPTMMSLSYAVALSALLLVESLRATILSNDNQLRDSSFNQFYEAFLDEKDAMARSISQQSQGKRTGGVFVVTHMAMIFGCAFPLWVNEVLQKVTGPDHVAGTGAGDILSLLPAMGIIVLGVGDAVGAIVGVYMGSHKWPGTKRTIEGSLGMFLSMVLSLVMISYLDPTSDTGTNATWDAALAGLYAIPQLLVLTLLEAFTCQIDNLCLPIAASILCLVGGGGGGI